jgi:hypothetical protein
MNQIEDYQHAVRCKKDKAYKAKREEYEIVRYKAKREEYEIVRD